MKKLWIDDDRPPPDETWVWVKTETEAMGYWHKHAGDTAEVSFDHDLGRGGDTRRLANKILGDAQSALRAPPRWYVHSANPVGAEYLSSILDSADRYWRHHQTKRFLKQSTLRRRA